MEILLTIGIVGLVIFVATVLMLNVFRFEVSDTALTVGGALIFFGLIAALCGFTGAVLVWVWA